MCLIDKSFTASWSRDGKWADVRQMEKNWHSGWKSQQVHDVSAVEGNYEWNYKTVQMVFLWKLILKMYIYVLHHSDKSYVCL